MASSASSLDSFPAPSLGGSDGEPASAVGPSLLWADGSLVEEEEEEEQLQIYDESEVVALISERAAAGGAARRGEAAVGGGEGAAGSLTFGLAAQRSARRAMDPPADAEGGAAERVARGKGRAAGSLAGGEDLSTALEALRGERRAAAAALIEGGARTARPGPIAGAAADASATASSAKQAATASDDGSASSVGVADEDGRRASRVTAEPLPLDDEALARALASQRSERLCVAQRRAIGARPRSPDPTSGPARGARKRLLRAPEAASRGMRAERVDSESDDDGRSVTRKRSASEAQGARAKQRRASSADEGTSASSRLRVARRGAEHQIDPWVADEGGSETELEEEVAELAPGHASAVGLEDDEPEAARAASEESDGADEERVPGLTVPGRLWRRLFPHQRTCLEWLWELHQQEVGGILGDEMGLGKTLQMIALWACLHASRRAGPCLVVCPATVLLQWKREVERWAPEIETVEVLHHSQGGADPGNRLALLRAICNRELTARGDASVCITSYEMVRSHSGQLLGCPWQYVVLDEGHKIRNPHAEITQVCKQFNTPHRIILSGAPIQNKLTELWSLFDFVFPGKLGTLPLFEEHFAIPIAMGTYANASEFKVQTAARCSMVLRDLLRPYLLRRMKADVDLAMPDKSEKVLFCRLTETQRDAYEDYLKSPHVEKVLSGAAHAFSALTTLLKICNHPHLYSWDAADRQAAGAAAAAGPKSAAIRYGDWRLSGKLRVLHQVLRPWLARGDRALLFCQTRQMLDIVQIYVESQRYAFLRLDGNTSVASRLSLIDRFNADPSIFLFLLTTRAGGLGINLTGANRVVLLDPDWNPANDLQARERAWRVGQTRSVAVFRLVTGGTLEEKVYQRQIFKTVLSNRVLTEGSVKNKTLKRSDLRDLLAPPADLGGGGSGGGGDAPAEAAIEAMAAEGGRPRADSGAATSGRNTGAPAEDRPAGTRKLEETSLLEGLLRGELLSGTLDHEREVDSGKGRESSIASVEARRVAERAAAALRESSENCARSAAGPRTPTWTGRNDGAGGPAHRFGAALSKTIVGAGAAGPAPAGASGSFFSAGAGRGAAIGSSALLQRVRQREASLTPEGAPLAANESPSASGSASEADSLAASLLQEIRSFFRSHGGRATTDQLVGRFRACAEPHLFKQLLRQVAQKQGKFWAIDARFS